MIGVAWAAAWATALLAAGDLCNRKLVGWLPNDPPRPGRKQHARPIPLPAPVTSATFSSNRPGTARLPPTSATAAP